LDFKSPSPQDKVYSVTELTSQIKSNLEGSFPKVWVVGEIADFARAHSGHLYFTLKDERSQLRAVMWRSAADKVKFDIDSGLQVICRGPINVYEPRGTYQLIVDLVEPKGKGALQLAFEQLKEKLSKEGLFDPETKKKLPALPKKIGVVTSPRGAAITDILRTLERRFAHLHVVIYPARVQGEGAAVEIARAIDYLGSQTDIDVIIAGRGGGSMEDLWAFNEEIVARAIHNCPVPIISAVGHEVDFTIADFVADIRASTPTAAAEMVIEKKQAFVERIDSLQQQMSHLLRYQVQEYKHRVQSLIQHRAFQNFKLKLKNLEQKVDELDMRAWNVIKNLQQKIIESRARTSLFEEKLQNLMREKIRSLKGIWERLAAELHNLSPLNILKKGYTLCWTDKGQKLVRDIGEVAENEELTVSFFKGELNCLIKTVDPKKTIKNRLDNKLGTLTVPNK
jgi:exodeoxyribonuclease VII large subunit